MRLILCSRSPFRRVKFCSRSQFISKGLVSKMSQNKWFMEYFDFILDLISGIAHIFARNILHSRTHPHNYFDFAPEVAKSIFVVAHPSVPFGFAHFTPRSGACSPLSFFFFSNPYGVANGARRTPLVVQALRACTPDPFGVRYKIREGDFITLRKLRFFFVVARSSAFGFLPARNRYPTGTGIKNPSDFL